MVGSPTTNRPNVCNAEVEMHDEISTFLVKVFDTCKSKLNPHEDNESAEQEVVFTVEVHIKGILSGILIFICNVNSLV